MDIFSLCWNYSNSGRIKKNCLGFCLNFIYVWNSFNHSEFCACVKCSVFDSVHVRKNSLVYKNMVVNNLVQTMASSTSCVRFNIFVTIYNPRTSEFIFYGNEERIFGKILNYKITLPNRLSRALSGWLENPVLEHFIFNETLKCLVDLRIM